MKYPVIASALYYEGHFGACDVVNLPDQLDPKKHHLLVLWGGSDISPYLYNEPVVAARAPGTPSVRDAAEVALYKRAVELGIPILGICRGAQLVCVMEGGKLWQHADNHHGDHDILVEGKSYRTNSCHHQIMRPTERAVVLGVTPCRSPVKINKDGQQTDMAPEPEIVFFPDSKALGIQGHPEWLPHWHDLNQLTLRFLKETLNHVYAR